MEMKIRTFEKSLIEGRRRWWVSGEEDENLIFLALIPI